MEQYVEKMLHDMISKGSSQSKAVEKPSKDKPPKPKEGTTNKEDGQVVTAKKKAPPEGTMAVIAIANID